MVKVRVNDRVRFKITFLRREIVEMGEVYDFVGIEQ